MKTAKEQRENQSDTSSSAETLQKTTKTNRFRLLKLGNESNQHPHKLFCVLPSHPADMKYFSYETV